MKKWVLILSFISVTFLGNTQTQSFAGNWIKITYLQCLDDSLPCDCFYSNYPPFLTYELDNIDSLFFGHYKISNFSHQENINFDVIDQMKVLLEKKISKVAHIGIKNDTLSYFQYRDSVLHKYIPINHYRYDYENIKCIEKINQLLISNGYKNIYKILKSDSLSCNCDWQYGVNIVYINTVNNEKKKYKSWNIEHTKQELIINKWNYPKEGKRGAKSKPYKKYLLKN